MEVSAFSQVGILGFPQFWGRLDSKPPESGVWGQILSRLTACLYLKKIESTYSAVLYLIEESSC